MSPKRYGIRYSVQTTELDEQLENFIQVTRDYEWHGPVVTRAQLIEATQSTLNGVREDLIKDDYDPDDLTPEIEAACMAVAQKAHFITGAWESDWNEEGGEEPKCGCLIGTIRMARGLELEDPTQDESEDIMEEIAIKFPERLSDVVFGMESFRARREGHGDPYGVFMVIG